LWRPDDPNDLPRLGAFADRIIDQQRARVAEFSSDGQRDLLKEYKDLEAAGLLEP
jgi:hypothetical protein